MALEICRDLIPSVPMVQADDLFSYSSVYLSVLFNLQKQGKDRTEIMSLNAQGVQAYKNIHPWFGPALNDFVMFERRPWFIMNGDTDILARIKLTGEDLESVRNREIAVYFYEPLFQRDKGTRCPAFYTSKSEDIYFAELLWLEDFNRNHGGNLKIVAYVCDYNLGDFLKQKKMHSQLRIETLDIFVLSHLFLKEWASRKHGDAKYQIVKKFICPNFRYEGFRELVVGFLAGLGALPEGYVSFFHQHDADFFFKDLPFDPRALKQWSVIENGIQSLQEQLPLVIDTKHSQKVRHENFLVPDWEQGVNLREDIHLEKATGEAFLSIVNETRFGVHCGEISEKILHPILARRPFVLIGAPYTLKYLKEMGFRTFSEYWDESYDKVKSHGQRMEIVLEIIAGILQRPLNTLHSDLLHMQERLQHNYIHLTRDLRSQLHRKIWIESERSFL